MAISLHKPTSRCPVDPWSNRLADYLCEHLLPTNGDAENAEEKCKDPNGKSRVVLLCFACHAKLKKGEKLDWTGTRAATGLPISESPLFKEVMKK
jgi:hypothetical protein